MKSHDTFNKIDIKLEYIYINSMVDYASSRMISVNLNQINDVLTDFDERIRNISLYNIVSTNFSCVYQKLNVIFFSVREKIFSKSWKTRFWKRNKLGLDYEELRISIFSDTIRSRSKTRIEHFTERNVLVSKLFRLTVLTANQSALRFTDTRCGLRSSYISPYYFS